MLAFRRGLVGEAMALLGVAVPLHETAQELPDKPLAMLAPQRQGTFPQPSLPTLASHS
ncbi:MAG: hypothetical protein ACK4R2_12390 [Roseateles sp.]